jgi:hypothetical protein
MNRRLGRPRASLDVVVRRKIPSPCQEIHLSQPAHSTVTVLTELQTPKKVIHIKELSEDTVYHQCKDFLEVFFGIEVF